MYPSLKLRSNLIEIGAAILVAGGMMMIPGPPPTAAWALAAVFGVMAGILVGQSIRSAPQAFQSAQTSPEVRAALSSTQVGRVALLAHWVLLPLLLVAAWWGGNIIAGAFGGLAVFLVVRDVVALRAVMDLAAMSAPSGR